MRSWWSPLRRRLEIVTEVHRRGDTVLFLRSFCVALVAPLLLRLPLPHLEALLEWSAVGKAGPASCDPDAVAATVLAMLQAGRPLVRRGCLTRGLTLYYCLRRAGVDVGLNFGMGSVAGGDGFEGHCWLVLNGEPYLEPRDPRPDYATTHSFRRRASNQGAPASRA
jgi:Transglutaminase-like superfamily